MTTMMVGSTVYSDLEWLQAESYYWTRLLSSRARASLMHELRHSPGKCSCDNITFTGATDVSP